MQQVPLRGVSGLEAAVGGGLVGMGQGRCRRESGKVGKTRPSGFPAFPPSHLPAFLSSWFKLFTALTTPQRYPARPPTTSATRRP